MKPSVLILMSKPFLILLVFYLLLVAYGVFNYFLLSKKEKIYTIGKVYDVSALGKNGKNYFFEYTLNGISYKGKTSGYGFNINSNKYLYVLVLKENAKEYSVYEFTKVPPCFSLNDVPSEGWKTLPKDTCK